MATQVPYNPVPQVAPTDQPIPYRQEQVPVGAFGGTSAQATEQLGSAESGVGNELYGRAVALEQLHQQAQASEAVANYTTKLGQRYEQFRSLQGKAAVDGYQSFSDDTNSIREQIRENLGSPFAQRAFDMESRTMQARAQWAAGAHAGDQNKAYITGSSRAVQDANTSAALLNPTDEANFKASRAANVAEANHQADVLGLPADDPKRQQMVAEATSTVTVARIQGLAKSAPWTAKAMLNDAVKNKEILGTELPRLMDFVNKQVASVGGREIAKDTLAGVGQGQGVVPIETAMKVVGGNESTNNYKPNGTGRHPDAPNGGHALGRYGIMNYNLAGWLREAGMDPMTEQQFIDDPQAQDNLFKFKFGQYMAKTGSFREALHMWFGKGHDDGHLTFDQYADRAMGTLARGAPVSQLVEQARAKAKTMDPDNDMLGDMAEASLLHLHAEQEREQREDEHRNKDLVISGLEAGPDGKLPTKLEDVLKTPEIESAYNGMDNKDQKWLLDRLTANAARGGYQATPQSEIEYTTLRGQFLDPNKSPEEARALLDSDFRTKPWPLAWVKELQGMQSRLAKAEMADPRLAYAMQVLTQTGLLRGAGISKQSNPDDYALFTGALHDVLGNYVKENARLPKDEEIKQIGSRLIQQQYRTSGFWAAVGAPGKEMMYQKSDIPEATRNKIVEFYHARGIEPSDADIHNSYIAARYSAMYGKVTPNAR